MFAKFRFFLRGNCNTSLPEETSDIPEEIHFNEDLCVDILPQEDAGQGNYVCGWVLTKCLKKSVNLVNNADNY